MNTHDHLTVVKGPITRMDGLLSAVATKGYAFENDFIHASALQAMQDEASALNLAVGDHISHPINKDSGNEVRQQHARAYRRVGELDVPIASRVSSALMQVARLAVNSYPQLNSWAPTEAGYQLYRNMKDYISAHRDRSSDQILAATINITGSATIEIHETLDDPMDYTRTEQIEEFTTSPGSIMFLRAPGFDQNDMLQTLHAVSPPTTPNRLILNLRQRPTILKSPQSTKWQ